MFCTVRFCFASEFRVKVLVVIGHTYGRMCNLGFFFVNLRNLTSVRLQQFILVENWLSVYVAAYLSLFNSSINYTKQTLFPLGKNASMGFSFSDNVRKRECSLKCMYVLYNCYNFTGFLCSRDFFFSVNTVSIYSPHCLFHFKMKMSFIPGICPRGGLLATSSFYATSCGRAAPLPSHVFRAGLGVEAPLLNSMVPREWLWPALT